MRRPQESVVSPRVPGESARCERIGDLERCLQLKTVLRGVRDSESGDESVEEPVGHDRIEGALSRSGTEIDHVAHPQTAVPGLVAKLVGEDVEGTAHGGVPVLVPRVDDIVRETAQHPLKVACREGLEKGDPVRKVAVDSTNGGTGAFGDHGRREPLEADLVDNGCRGIQQSGQASSTASLHRRVAQGHECFGRVLHSVVRSHGKLLYSSNYILALYMRNCRRECENVDMCGRFVVAGASSDLVDLFDVDLPADDLPAPSWNVAPTDRVAIVLDTISKTGDDDVPVRRLESARWGLVPGWAKDPKVGVTAFNARIETLSDKAHFKNAVRKRRAVVPATGYYEWHTVAGTKTPHFIHLPDGELFGFAGLYEWWRIPAAGNDATVKWLLSTTIITRAATGELASIHDRMPLFLQPELLDEWLDPHTDEPDEVLEAAFAGGEKLAARAEFYAVGRAVGNVRNNSPELIERAGPELSQL